MRAYRVDQVIQQAYDLCGIPYRENSSSMEGSDCIGLALLFYRLMGTNIPYDNSYGYKERRAIAGKYDILLSTCSLFFDMKEKESTSIFPMNLLLFQNDGRDVMTHIGVAITGFEFLHMDRIDKVSKIDRLRSISSGFVNDRSNSWDRKLRYVGKLRRGYSWVH